MTARKRLDRETFISEGHKRNDGVAKAEQVDPVYAWKLLYGNRQFVWLDMRMEATNADPLADISRALH